MTFSVGKIAWTKALWIAFFTFLSLLTIFPLFF